MGMSLKRLLFLAHRWLGIVLCAFFAMWFMSGMVMMYVGYPKLTDDERLAHLPVVDGAGLLAPSIALANAGLAGPLKELRLAAASAGRPAYFVTPDGPRSGHAMVVVDARTGRRVPGTNEARALASARAYAGPNVALRYAGTVDEDAFTHSRGLDAHRPLHRVMVEDAEGTLLHISGATGEVVRDAPRTERLWNYAGAWIHWLYPFRGNAFDRYWADIVNWLSIAGIALALTGTIAGILRWRFRRPYRSGARTPYPGAMMRWHHIGGLLFALTTITWIFSGLMSMNPWHVFDGGAAPLRMAALTGGKLDPATLDATPAPLLAGGNVRELRWTQMLGQTLVLAQPATGRPAVLDARAAQPVSIDGTALQMAAAGLLGHPVRRIERLAAYDLYYYSRDAHTMTGGSAKPLPVLRVVFADPQESWVHLDPHTGAVINRSDRHKRWSRWLFAMLHSWDWLPLLERRPLWDAVLIGLGLGGTVMSVTGIVIGWRRLGRKLGAASRAPERKETKAVS
ncbi:PepSY domain-containing protein [Massilia sp. METH4]|uniref:PepSY domain-containing protein n=1 Tax=Massilia sp. METH4 TaxID=3123041 RepID=UPI0030CEFDB0